MTAHTVYACVGLEFNCFCFGRGTCTGNSSVYLCMERDSVFESACDKQSAVDSLLVNPPMSPVVKIRV